MSKTTIIAEPGKQEVVIKRMFDATAKEIFHAYTDPEAISQWWGMGNTTIDKCDPRPGGQWRFIDTDAKGKEAAFHGVYHDVIEPTSVVWTFEWEGLPGHVLMETVTFDEKDGKTQLTAISVFQTIEDRDGMVSMGMEQGVIVSMDKLAALVESKG